MEQFPANDPNREPLAIAKYVPTEKTYQDMYWLQTLKKRRVMRMIGSILILLSGLQLFQQTPTPRQLLVLGLFAFAGIYYIIWSQFRHMRLAKKTYSKMLGQFERYSELPAIEQTYYRDHIAVRTEKSDRIRTYPYEGIKEIRENEDMIVFVCQKEVCIAVPRRAFHAGSIADTVEYIRKNYIQKRK